jgi:Ca-activated chloride channel family protein
VRRAVAIALAAALAGFSPFRTEERNVREGNERLAAGDADAALRRYADAEKAAGPHPELDYDRGNALFRLGKGAQAREAWRRSQQEAPASLSSRASQNIGTALAAEGDRAGAIAALTDALRRDPKNEDARFNLEVLLRREEEAQRQQAQQQRGTAPQEQGTGPQQPRSQAGGEQPRQPTPRAGPQGRQPEEGGAQPRSSGAAGAEGGEVSRKEAEQILDAFRGQEKVAPPPAQQEHPWWRADGDHDW